MRKIAIVVVSILVSGAVFASNLNIGVLDVHKIMQNSPQVTAMQAKLRKQFAPQEKTILATQKELKADVAKYTKNGPVMKAADKKALQNKIMEEQQKLRSSQARFQQNLMRAQNGAMKSIINAIQKAVNIVAKQKKLNLVITKSSAVYNDADLDITRNVVKYLQK